MKLRERGKIKDGYSCGFSCIKEKETPWYAKIMVAIIVICALSPVVLIPDFIPILGYLDDVIILPTLITLTVKLIPKNIFTECRIQSERI